LRLSSLQTDSSTAASVISLAKLQKIWRINQMVKIRLKRLGYKKNPTYRIVVLNSTTKREAAPIQQLGFYNPKTKEMQLDKQAALDWVKKGAQPTQTVQFLINNCTDEGKLNYVKKETVKLSKKAQAKLKAEQEAAKSAETAE
jgi:small subunit ribosomal protein S16